MESDQGGRGEDQNESSVVDPCRAGTRLTRTSLRDWNHFRCSSGHPMNCGRRPPERQRFRRTWNRNNNRIGGTSPQTRYRKQLRTKRQPVAACLLIAHQFQDGTVSHSKNRHLRWSRSGDNLRLSVGAPIDVSCEMAGHFHKLVLLLNICLFSFELIFGRSLEPGVHYWVLVGYPAQPRDSDVPK